MPSLRAVDARRGRVGPGLAVEELRVVPEAAVLAPGAAGVQAGLARVVAELAVRTLAAEVAEEVAAGRVVARGLLLVVPRSILDARPRSLPTVLAMAKKYSGGDVFQALLNNANVGGENVHRGEMLGLLWGCHNGLNVSKFTTELKDHAELAVEIDASVAAVTAVYPDLASDGAAADKDKDASQL